jgi:hypothetical protein
VVVVSVPVFVTVVAADMLPLLDVVAKVLVVVKDENKEDCEDDEDDDKKVVVV